MKIKLVIVYFFILIMRLLKGQTPINDPHWELLWEDNFDFFDSNKWIKADYCDHGGGDQQLYLAKNVFVSNGNLVLRLNKEIDTCPQNQPLPATWACAGCPSGKVYQYTSGWAETTLPYYVQYGYIEARVKIPYCSGLFPAFWTWIGLPTYQEIDIFEMIPGIIEHLDQNSSCLPNSAIYTHTNRHMTSNIHLSSNEPCDPDYKVSEINDYTQWHIYAIEWSPSRIIWYIDNYPVRYYVNSGNQLKDPTRIIFDLSTNSRIEQCQSFPQDLLIDYVRAYRLKTDCNNFIDALNYDFTSYDNKEKNYIQIGKGGGYNIVPPNLDIKMRASQFIELDGHIEMPIGSSVYLDADKMCANDISSECNQLFNACSYNFANYDNTIKKEIELGGTNCILMVMPASYDLELKATDKITIKNHTTIKPDNVHKIILKIEPCH